MTYELWLKEMTIEMRHKQTLGPSDIEDLWRLCQMKVLSAIWFVRSTIGINFQTLHSIILRFKELTIEMRNKQTILIGPPAIEDPGWLCQMKAFSAIWFIWRPVKPGNQATIGYPVPRVRGAGTSSAYPLGIIWLWIRLMTWTGFKQ